MHTISLGELSIGERETTEGRGYILMVGEVVSMQGYSTCTTNFAVCCGLVPSHHVRLVSTREGEWDYVGGCMMQCEEGVGADLPSMFALFHTSSHIAHQFIVSGT
jgi:hypothetical protein